jgi:hypothetical protein
VNSSLQPLASPAIDASFLYGVFLGYMIHENPCQVLHITVSNRGYPVNYLPPEKLLFPEGPNGVPPLLKQIALQQVDVGSSSLYF